MEKPTNLSSPLSSKNTYKAPATNTLERPGGGVLLMTKSVVIARLPICFFRSSEEAPRGQEPVLFVAADCCDGLKHTMDT